MTSTLRPSLRPSFGSHGNPTPWPAQPPSHPATLAQATVPEGIGREPRQAAGWKPKSASTSRSTSSRISKRSSSSSAAEEDCEHYAAIRETREGKTYVLKRTPDGRVRRKMCRARADVATAPPKHSQTVLMQGEHVLQSIFKPRNKSQEQELDRARREFRANPVRHVWLGVSSDEISCWDERFKDFKFGQEIGKGSFGSVHEACADQSCRYVLKISFLRDSFEREVAEREIAIMEQLNDSGLTAKLVKWKLCADKALMLMERFDMTAEQLGHKQFEKFMGKGTGSALSQALLFTDTQVQQLFDLAYKLSEMGIIHGDLKLDNVMYRVADERFIIIDFGFTGTYKEHNGKFWSARWGFTHAMGCDQQTPVPETLVRWANIWQLLIDLGTYPIVLVAIEDPLTRAVREIRLLVGLGPRFAKILTRDAIRAIQQQCPQPRGELWELRKEHSKMRDAILRKVAPYWA